MPIRVRLTLLFAAVTAVVAVIGGVVFVQELSAGLRGSVASALRSRADSVAQQLPDRSGIEFRDPAVPASRSGASGSAEITQVLTVQGQVVDSAGAGVGASLLSRAQLVEVRRHPITFEQRRPHAPAPFQILATTVAGATPMVIVVGTSVDTVDAAVRRVEIEILIGGLIAVVAAGFAAWLLSGAALAPVERMRRQAARISEHDDDVALEEPRSRDEIAALARTFNGLLGRLHGALSRQRGFVSAAGHELRTPLAILKGELELASKPGRTRTELAEAVRVTSAETDRLLRLADDLLLLSRVDEASPVVHPHAQDLSTLMMECVAAFEKRAWGRGVQVRTEVRGAPVAEVDGLRFRQIIDNLLDNAVRMAPPGSQVVVQIEQRDAAAVVRVVDEGPGFPADFLPRAFERFSRPDDSRDRDHGGAGLGLSIVKSLVEAHHGTVAASNGATGGAVVQVILPTVQPRR